MKREDFAIGQDFWCGGERWLCTDVGTRTIAAIDLRDPAARLTLGPPYAVVEHVFDEYDMPGCRKTQAEWLGDFGDD